jgi:uncharacterized protein YjbJ (UPF0337 family)
MEHATRAHERTQELFGQMTGKGLESMGLWLDANQRLWRELMSLTADAAREQVRFVAEAQSRALEMLAAPAVGWVELQKEAAGWYQKTLRDGVEGMQRAFEAVAENGGRAGGDGRGPTEPRGGRSRELLKSQWPGLRGRVRQQWGKLSDEDLDQIQGDADALLEKVQEVYGRSREQAEQDLERWLGRQRLARAS